MKFTKFEIHQPMNYSEIKKIGINKLEFFHINWSKTFIKPDHRHKTFEYISFDTCTCTCTWKTANQNCITIFTFQI
jgi:hypothetical protein